MSETRKGRISGRVLILIENIPLHRDVRVQRECQSLLDAGYAVTVVCPRGERSGEPALDRVRLLTYPSSREASTPLGYVAEYAYSLLMMWLLVGWAALTHGFDVIQACSPPDLLWLVTAPSRLFGKKVVFDHHDLSPELFEASFGARPLIHCVLRGLERVSVRLADAVIATNESGREIVAERTGAPHEKFVIVRNGPLLATVHAPLAPHPELKRNRDWLVSWHGIMASRRGPELAIRAVEELVHGLGRRDCGFAFVGDGSMRPELEHLVHAFELEDWVWFPGWLDQEQIFEYLATTDIGLSPDPCGIAVEWATPGKAIEFMGFGVPVVGFQRPQQEVLVGGAGVFVADNSPTLLAEAIDSLLDDPTRRERMGRLGRRRVEESLAWDHQARRYVALYHRLMAQGPSSP